MSPPNNVKEPSFQRYLKGRFGTESDNYRRIVPLLFRRLDDAPPGSEIAASYRLWRESIDVNVSEIESAVEESIAELDLGDGEADAERFLYSLQSYYALVLQLDRIVNVNRLVEGRSAFRIAYERLSEEFGNLLNQPEDRLFYGWLTGIDFAEEPFDALVSALADAPPRSAGEDVFKDLYQDLVANPFRKALGEFYTREWVADLVLDEIEYDGSSVLDPACGSGAFLVKAARRAIEGSETPGAMERIEGFDLNPVAVMAAKSNLLGALAGHLREGSLTPAELGDVRLPVYWTNSIVWTEPDLLGNNVTLLSPYGELHFPDDPEEAVEKVRADVAEWADGRSFDRILDAEWLDGVARSFAAPVVAPPFDYVVGNPPWVSPDRMPKEYRDRVTDLLDESGFLEPFDPDYLSNRFPNRQFVAALPFFEVTTSRYLAEDGTCAYLVTSSLLKSMNGGGFREQMREWRVSRILDFTPYTDIHQNASSWAFVPVIDDSPTDGDDTRYEFFVPTDGAMDAHPGSCRAIETPDVTLHVCSWDVDLADLPFLTDDPRSPWFTAPPSVLETYREITEGTPHVGENYRFTRGLITGRNGVYLLDGVERRNGRVEASTRASDGRFTVEPELVYPFVEGKHLASWEFDHTHLLLPYDVPEWEPIPEKRLRSESPEAASYLRDNERVLRDRRTHTIERQLDGGSPYYVVETREILGTRPVVGVREMSPYLEAAVIPETLDDGVLGERESVVAHTLNFVVPDSEAEAHYLAGLFNSWPLRTLVYDLAQPKGGRPGKRYDMHLVSSLPVPEYDPASETHREIAELSREAHEADDDRRIAEAERRLDELVCEDVYELSAEQSELLRRHYRRLAYTPD